ncbi:ferric reductase-like transmembrane domain-containing protein [Streptomyces sp. TRM 70351]|uniref:ferric reductase-like transmembrane domain-containing protein n=1 Tax=Streptomyces sp. TRM 70351 TaxID=3116552 RepID=UPI002E7B43B8|nr:ferric reductase-like transmembrane domain-containing protein [Streptomyces sp. TRM 70351]MEE1929936.1 ferric reductase-like transmembrane domain-containing protein [Streptomyces sp. TRM 70351]
MVSRAPAAAEEGTGPPDGTGRARRALRADLRAAVPDALAALLVTASVFVFLYVRVDAGTSDTLVVMPFLADAGTYWMYWLSQAFGWAGLLWAYLTVVLGLLVSGTRPGWLRRVSPARLERLHRTTSLSTIALMFAHALAFAAELVRYEAELAWGSRVWTAFVDSFVPGGYDSGTGQIAIPIGQGALYLAVPLGLLFYVRQRIGPKLWRVLHRFVIVTYVLSVWHTLLYGTNVWYDGWPRTALWLLQIPLALLLLDRLMRPARRAERLGAPGAGPRRAAGWGVRLLGRVAVAAVVVALVAVVVSGRDGGRERPAPEPAAPAAQTDG